MEMGYAMVRLINLEDAYNRLKCIEWSNRSEAKPSHTALGMEFIRRAALWDDYIGHSNKKPFFDLAKFIAPKIRADKEIIQSVTRLVRGKVSLMEMSVCVWYLHWCNVHPEIYKECNELPTLYEPLIKIFEYRGYFYTHHDSLFFGERCYPLNSWKGRLNNDPIDISDSSLEDMDKRNTE